MAYASSHASHPSIVDIVRGFVSDIKTAYLRRAAYYRALNELEALSDRDLSDMGLSRADIESVAQEAALAV